MMRIKFWKWVICLIIVVLLSCCNLQSKLPNNSSEGSSVFVEKHKDSNSRNANIATIVKGNLNIASTNHPTVQSTGTKFTRKTENEDTVNKRYNQIFLNTLKQRLSSVYFNNNLLINTYRENKNGSLKSSLQKWNRSNPIIFLHIGKNGGTSFDSAIGPIVRKLGGKYIGNRHFDWSAIESYDRPEVVVMLRNPVSRAVSHFHYVKTESWTSKLKIRHQNLSEYLKDYQSMLDTRGVWQDGQAAVSWLTGTHIANWVGIKPSQVASREKQSLNMSDMCLRAAERLEQTLWFGILEDQSRSFELLKYQLGYDKVIKLSHSNANRKWFGERKSTEEDEHFLKLLMPQDIWLYEYAKLLFEARWNLYKTGIYNKPTLPAIPEPTCLSTRFAIRCDRGPLAPLYYQGKTDTNHQYLI